MPQMVETLGTNASRQTSTAALFELGRVFLRNDQEGIGEEDRAAIGLMGQAGRGGIDSRRAVGRLEMFSWLKGIVEAVLRAHRVEDVEWVLAPQPGFELGWSIALRRGDVPCGMLGLVGERVRSAWRMVGPVGVAELALPPLLARTFHVPEPKSISAFPSVRRDLAIVVDEQVTHRAVEDVIWKSASDELTEVTLFDIFRGEGIGEGRKSLAYSLVYRSLERSLTDEEANGYHDAVKNGLKNELKSEIREG